MPMNEGLLANPVTGFRNSIQFHLFRILLRKRFFNNVAFPLLLLLTTTCRFAMVYLGTILSNHQFT